MRYRKKEKVNTLDKNSLFTLLEKDLSEQQRTRLLQDIEELDLAILEKQKEVFFTKPILNHFEPFEEAASEVNEKEQALGEQLFRNGSMGCLLVAGGEGTRLGFQGPKGTFPVSLIQKKSLFQIFSEKVLAASKLAQKPLQLAVMTSPQNDAETKKFFADHNFFGLSQNQVDFFVQGTLPFLDNESNPILEEDGSFAKGSDGNGSALKYFVKSGIWEKWKNLNIQFLNFVLIDNPLADPFDRKLLGFHAKQKADLTIKCIKRESAEEKVGLIVKKKGGEASVVEYSEAPEKVIHDLKFSLANISLFCMNMDFVKEVSNKILPLHRAYKKANRDMAWKFEYFIFDILPYAKKIMVLIYPTNLCFAPLKTREGPDGIDALQNKLLERDKIALSELTGRSPPNRPFELAQEFYYPNEALRKKWRGKEVLEGGYIKS